MLSNQRPCFYFDSHMLRGCPFNLKDLPHLSNVLWLKASSAMNPSMVPTPWHDLKVCYQRTEKEGNQVKKTNSF